MLAQPAILRHSRHIAAVHLRQQGSAAPPLPLARRSAVVVVDVEFPVLALVDVHGPVDADRLPADERAVQPRGEVAEAAVSVRLREAIERQPRPGRQHRWTAELATDPHRPG